MSSGRPHRVTALVLDGAGWLDLAGPVHLFGRHGAPHYALVVATDVPGRVRTDAGPDLHVRLGPAALADADTVVVPGGSAAVPSPAVLVALRGCAARGARLVSVGTGALALGAAGLLDGHRATTDRAAAADLQRRCPRARVEVGTPVVDDGAVLSCSAAAGPALCLHLVRCDHGPAAALDLARRAGLALPDTTAGTYALARDVPAGPHAVVPRPRGAPDQTLGATQDWARGRLAADLSLARLAAHAQVSPRTFLRRFRAETGLTPASWIAAQRVAAARLLLETTTRTVEQIARDTGLGSAESLRVHFRDQLHTTPTAYRRASRGW